MDIRSVQPEDFRSKLPTYIRQDVKSRGLSTWFESENSIDWEMLRECKANNHKVEVVMRDGEAIKGIPIDAELYSIRLSLVIDGSNVTCDIDLWNFEEINKVPTRSEAMKAFYSTDQGLLQKDQQSKRMMGNSNKTGRGQSHCKPFQLAFLLERLKTMSLAKAVRLLNGYYSRNHQPVKYQTAYKWIKKYKSGKVPWL